MYFGIGISNSIIPDYFFIKAIIMLGPTIGTFITALSIPLSMLGDYLYEG